ncbi:MAG: GHMP kinase [Ruminococcaceae bacterium]|nr:GHMP kinase [Oscillospiraceae bacterium]
MNAAELFERTYQHEPDGVSFCPYRVCPLGAHVDHNLGKITGFAIDKGIYAAYAADESGAVTVASAQFDTRQSWSVHQPPKCKVGDWADYLRGATKVLKKQFPLERGLRVMMVGDLPIGGLSSSAAVIISFLSALCRVNDVHLTKRQMVDFALEAEHDFVEVACGKLDQSCEVFGKKDQLLYLDTKDDSYELLSKPSGMKPFGIGIFFSGVERNLIGTKYNMRVDEARSAAYELMAYAGMEYGKFSETNLRDVPYEVFLQYRDRLPETFRRRAEHWYGEYDRVEKGVEAWKKGDIEAFGALSFESGASSITKWETGSPELKTIYEIMLSTDGIYGGRFSGAGFKGCCMALVDPEKWESIRAKVQTEYFKAFPELENKYSACLCASADGVLL